MKERDLLPLPATPPSLMIGSIHVAREKGEEALRMIELKKEIETLRRLVHEDGDENDDSTNT